MKKGITVILTIVIVMMFIVSGCTTITEKTEAIQSAQASESKAAVSESQSAANESQSTEKFTLGFNNYGDDLEFFKNVGDGLHKGCEKVGLNFIRTSSAQDPVKMKSNVDAMLLQGANIIVDFNVKPEVGNTMSTDLKAKGIPMIGIDCQYTDAYFYGGNNEHVGLIMGEYLANYANTNWDGKINHLLMIGLEKSGEENYKRTAKALDGLQKLMPDFSKDNSTFIGADDANFEKAKNSTADFLNIHQGMSNIAIAVNDDALAVAVLAAVETANRQKDVVIISTGCGTEFINHIRTAKEGDPWVASVSFFPEKYGDEIAQMALDILTGKNVDKQVYVKHTAIDKTNIDQYYPE